MSDLKERLIKSSTVKGATTLDKSKFFNEKDVAKTNVPMLNLALTGRFDGGLPSGLGVLAGPSRHFKTNMGLVMVAAYLRKYPDSFVLFYDNEHGATPDYFKSMGVDPERVIHCPFRNIEQLKFDMVARLESIKRGDKVIVFVDSVGAAASKKEAEDAVSEKSVQDMSRPKAMKSLMRIISPYFTELDIPGIMIAHTYDSMDLFPKAVVSGGTGIVYHSNWIFIIGKRQIKDGKQVIGYDFVLNADKSRFVKEKSQFPITVTFDGNINMFSGLLDLAQELGFVIKPSNGWYSLAFLDTETGEISIEEKKWRAADTDCLEFWKPMFKHQPFLDAAEKRYRLGAIEVDHAAMQAMVEELI